MFTRLIASRPTRHHDPQGLAVSLFLHGAVFTAALLATTVARDAGGVYQPPLYIPLPPLAPPSVEPAAPASPVATAPESPPRTPTLPLPVTSVPSLPIPGPVSTTLPPPLEGPWTAPAGASSAPVGDAGAGAPGTATGLAGGAFSDLQVDVPAALLPRSPLPQYPASLRMLRSDGHARLRFVVDARGRVELATVEIVEASHPAFAAAVRAALPRMRFSPARIGDRGVRQLVEFPITFRLEP
jgi:TonB family protein